jgi:polar amino acid transport system substrate-binding protein
MSVRLSLPRVAALLCTVLVGGGLVACSPEPDGNPPPRPTASQSGPSGASASCSAATLKTFKPGVLTIGTDKPAYPPWFVDNEPSSGKGFESAVAYAVAAKLGFGQDKVTWVTVPFNSSYAPGDKKFDFDINEISITPDRRRVVDFSAPYYTVTQGVVTLKSSRFAAAKTLADLADAKFGAQVGTTSLAVLKDRVKPTKAPAVFNDTNDAKSQLQNGVIDAIVVDAPTAGSLTTEIDNSVVVGRIKDVKPEQFGLLLAKGSPLLTCVNQAVAGLSSGGDLQRFDTQYLAATGTVPELG